MSNRRLSIITHLSVLAILFAATAWAQAPAGSPARNRRILAPDGSALDATDPSVSDNGRFVAFVSYSTNLVPDDDNGRSDIFVYDRTRQTFEWVSGDVQLVKSWGYVGGPAISRNGLIVAFSSTEWDDDGFSTTTVYAHDRSTRQTTQVAAGSAPSLSGDGRFAAFQSDDATLVSDSNQASDIFVLDRTTGALTRVSVDADGTEANGASFAPVLSADGRRVLFLSYATNLIEGDTNRTGDLFVKDRVTGAISRVNVGPAGQANGWTSDGRLTADGYTVVFSSYATNLVLGDTNGSSDVFVRDLRTEKTTRVSIDSFGRQANSHSGPPMITANGRYVAFYSSASNLVREVPVYSAVLMHDRKTGVTQRIDLDARGNPAADGVFNVAFSGNARVVTMTTYAPLVDDDTDENWDFYIRDLGTVTLTARFTALVLALQDVGAAGMLEKELTSARAASDAGDRNAACRAMTRFEREVQARWNRDVSSTQAEALFGAAGSIGRLLGCLDGSPSAFRFSRWTVRVAENAAVRNVFTGDVDGDQLVDVVTDSAPTITVLAGDGRGSFRSQVSTGLTGVVMAAVDLNADGRTDLVVRDEEWSPALRLLISARRGAFAFTQTHIVLDAPPISVAVGDLTGDGHVDVVVGNNSLTTATLIAGAGRGRFGKPQAIDTGGYTPTHVALGDVTGDGHLDLVYLYYSYLFIARGTGNGPPSSWEYLGPGISNFRLAEITGDNVPELIAWKQGRVDVYRFDGSSVAPLATLIGRPVWNLHVAELNNDQRPDLMIFESDRSVSIVQGNGDGTFGIRERFWTRPASGSASAADMNRDGKVDLVVATRARGTFPWELGTSGVTVLLNSPVLFVETPNEETAVAIGSLATIGWNHDLPANTLFRIDVSRDAGKTWRAIAPRVAGRRYEWSVTGPATHEARFRVASLSSPSAADMNNENVSIGAPSLKLNLPLTNENWGIGTERRITFEHNLGTRERVHLDLSRDAGRSWTRIDSDVLLNGTSSAQYPIVATGPQTATARVRVSWARDPSLKVESGTFRIAAPFLQLVAPLTGSTHPQCTAMPITWRHNLGPFERMNTEVSYDGGREWWPVATDYPNTGFNRATVWHWVTAPETRSGMVRVTWTKDDALTATVGSLFLGRDEGYDCDDD